MITVKEAQQLTKTPILREFGRVFNISPQMLLREKNGACDSKILKANLLAIEFCHKKGILKDWRDFCEKENCGEVGGAIKKRGCSD